MLMDTTEVTKRIISGQQIVFAKFGDGEILCMLGEQGSNCDGDSYTEKLRNMLISSLRFYSVCNNPNVFIGHWPGTRALHSVELKEVLDKYNISLPKLARYHLIMNHDCVNSDMKVFDNPNMYDFVKSIQETRRKKIVFSNENNKKLQLLFKADSYIVIPPRNWVVDYDNYFEKVKSEITDGCILFTAGGQGSKALIADLLKLFPGMTCLDIGASFDLLCQKRKTRMRPHDYETEKSYYKELLPENW